MGNVGLTSSGVPPKTTMRLLSKELVDDYLRDDSIARLLEREEQPGDDGLASHRWLKDMPPKRAIKEMLYGDLLREESSRRPVVDVGGGLSALTRILAADHDYTLVDMFAHDDVEPLRMMEQVAERRFARVQDWHTWTPDEPLDLVIANDIFPNVDQRLALFLRKFVPIAREIRLSLTFHNRPRFYFARRLEADEVLCLLAWDGDATWRALAPYLGDADPVPRRELADADEALFANGRQVCVVTLGGGLGED